MEEMIRVLTLFILLLQLAVTKEWTELVLGEEEETPSHLVIFPQNILTRFWIRVHLIFQPGTFSTFLLRKT